jgi:hypothetical protein
MTVARGIAAAATLTAVAVAAAATAWADTTMSGHYIRTETDPQTGQSQTADWYLTPCGDGCASVGIRPDAPTPTPAHLVNGQWTLDSAVHTLSCPDGTVVPNAVSAHYTWDPNTLAGTVQVTYNVAACGHPAGYQNTNNVQLKQAT